MSKAILINYNLKASSSQYGGLAEKIRSYPNWCHLGGSVWVVITTQTPSQVFNVLTPFIAAGEQLLCVDITNDNWACEGYSKEVVDWLQAQLVQTTPSRW